MGDGSLKWHLLDYLKGMDLPEVENKTITTDPCYKLQNVNGTEGNLTSSLNCSGRSLDIESLIENINLTYRTPGTTTGNEFYTYVTPVIFTVGMIGNILSLRVFLTKNMRKLSASVYLAALSTADIMALCFYVLIEWIKRGIPSTPGQLTAPFLEQNGICQILLYLQYVSRFVSAWLVACFTLERYIGVCHPLKRKDICDVRSSRKIVLMLIVIALIFCSFKPWLSSVTEVGDYHVPFCSRTKKHKELSFILDCIFGISITLLPFVIITTLNALIIRKLFIRNKRHRECKVITEESIIRLEFTLILIAISFFFIAFNMPYTAVWFKQFLLSKNTEMDGFYETESLLLIARTIFNMNYCVNFFLYSVTGAYFRKELQMLFTYKSKAYQSYHRCSVHNTNSNTPQSWI